MREITHKFKAGDVVLYRPSFGSGPLTKVTILDLDEKDGRAVYGLDNDRWCYEDSIQRKVK